MKRNKHNLSSYLLVYKLYLLGVLVALVITSSCVLVLSHSFGYIIDRTIVANDPQMLNLALVGFIGMAILLALATGIRYSLITLTGEYVTRDIRKDIYSKILSLSPSFYESSKSGEILSHLTTDITLLQSILSSTVSVMMRNALMLLGSLIMLAISSIKLTLMILFIVPFIIAPISYFSARLKRSAKQYQADVAGLAAISEETIYSIKTVQAYAREEWQQNMFDALLKKILNSAWSRVSTRALLIFIVISLIFCGIGFILWVGGRDVLSGALSLGQLTTFIFLSLICATTSMSLVEAFGEIQRASAAAQRIFIFLQEQSSVSDPLLPLKLETKGCDRLEFKDVVFSYPSDSKKEILSSISFVVETGQVLAIVGESGAGKSTIVQLILRFYDIQKGEILIDGINIKDLPLQELRQNFGYVGQDPVIFSTSAYNNILYGRPTATMEEVIEAAKVASAYEFIEGLHDGFKTFLGEKGVKLSGGQKQRIAIARAILKNPKILLLDEATSALDNKNENAIQNALEKLMYNRTTVVIAHRASTIINANEIILIKNGVIAARGEHNQLITNNIDYKQHFANLTELKEVI